MSSKLPDGDDAAGLWTRLSAAKVRFSYRGEQCGKLQAIALAYLKHYHTGWGERERQREGGRESQAGVLGVRMQEERVEEGLLKRRTECTSEREPPSAGPWATLSTGQ